MIYFDNAATSFPKPEQVVKAVVHYMTGIGANPGRSGHRLSIEAGELVFSARQLIADLFNVSNPMKVVLSFNATDALNLAIQGILQNGGHAITSSMEHNSTARPLWEMERRGIISLSVIPCSTEGRIDPEDIIKNLKPDTRLVVINHGSNVFGTVQPVADIGALCRERGITFLVDAAQTAGILPIDMERDSIDLLACAGHKGLYGPTGTGALVLADEFDYKKLPPLRYGGTGSRSDKTEQPDFMPDIFESGTLNVAGLSGLVKGVEFLNDYEGGLEAIGNHKALLVKTFHEQAGEKVKGYRSYIDPEKIKTGVISFNLEGMTSSEVAQKLSDRYDIMSRQGLHCSPLSHKTIGTFPDGTVRFGFGLFNTVDEVEQAVQALSEISSV